MRPIIKNTVDNQDQLQYVLDEIKRTNLTLEHMTADNPKRAFLRFAQQHSSKNGCEYCFEIGVSFRKSNSVETFKIVQKIKKKKSDIESKIELLDEDKDSEQIQTLLDMLKHLSETESMAKINKTFSHIVWPANTRNGESRTKEKILDIVEQIEAGIELTPAQKMGIKGRSPLLDIEGFDFIKGIQTEYMHLVALGVVKRLLELCFSVGETRSRVTKTKLTPPTVFNELMKTIKFVREFSRRARILDLSIMKAQEMRNILLFFFPLITECLSGKEKEVKLWEMFAFMIRACILPENEFSNVNIANIKYCLEKFYILYEQLFGPQNCTYSVHVLCSHLMMMRESGPLTETSAYKFEAFYAELRNSFQPGTQSVLKQMFQTVLLKRMLGNHVCQEKIFYSEKDTALECNSLIYTYENNVHLIYKIQSIENNDFICNQLGNHPIEFPCTNMLNWASVGVYRKGGLSSENVVVKREQVAGKVLKVKNVLLTCPVNIMREK